MKDDLLPSHLCTTLMRIGTRMASIFDQKFSQYGLTQAQFRVLLAVWESNAEGISPSTLADRLLIERATVSVLTTRLVVRGWLARQPGENRRTFLLVLTEAGRVRLQEVLPHAVLLADETVAAFPREDLQAALTLLERLESQMRKGE